MVRIEICGVLLTSPQVLKGRECDLKFETVNADGRRTQGTYGDPATIVREPSWFVRGVIT